MEAVDGPIYVTEILEEDWPLANRRIKRRDGSYLRVPLGDGRYQAFTTVPTDPKSADSVSLKGDDLAEAVAEAIATIPTGNGNISSSQRWSMNRLQAKSKYTRLGQPRMSAVAGAKALRDQGIEVQTLDLTRFSSGIDAAYGMLIREAHDRDLVLDVLGIADTDDDGVADQNDVPDDHESGAA